MAATGTSDEQAADVRRALEQMQAAGPLRFDPDGTDEHGDPVFVM